MKFHFFLTSILVVGGFIDSILAEKPCPPVPELATIVNTPEKCNCFYALQGSGVVFGDATTYDKGFNDDSVQNVAQSGQFIGVDGISEYISFVNSKSGFIKSSVLVEHLFLDMTGTKKKKCVATIAERRRMSFNPIFTQGNTEMCVDVLLGRTLYYTMTGKPAAPITINKANSWISDKFITSTYPFIANTQATAEFVCDTIVNTCGYDKSRRKSKKKSKSKKRKSPKHSNAMKECLKKFNTLEIYDKGDLSYADGNTKSCRILHSYFAKTNPVHCPHISFEADEDENGLVKCNKSKQTPLLELFTKQQLESFSYASNFLGLGNTGVDIKYKACSDV